MLRGCELDELDTGQRRKGPGVHAAMVADPQTPLCALRRSREPSCWPFVYPDFPRMSHTHPAASEYRFTEDRHTAVIVCVHVWSDGLPITMVSHDSEGDWQFLCVEGEHSEANEAMVVCLEHVVSCDPTVNELASMCTSHVARRSAVGSPWQIDDDTSVAIQETIREHGWWVGLVPGGDDQPGFAYTIGLHEAFGHPEIIVFGLGIDTMHRILNICGDRVREGARFEAGADARDIVEGFDVRFRGVNDEASHAEYLGYGCQHYRSRDFPVLQCLWPDKSGRFPGDPELAPSIAKLQPLLR